ncbi:MAG TPA: ferredoxin [Lachnospiraceae bacterium]|nr:ferredoxin [Lachnospiraceae bacterium]
MIKRVYAAYFSPAGSTGAVTQYIADRIAKALRVQAKTIDFTLPDGRKTQYSFEAEDLVVLGMPTYAGRLPNKALPFLRQLFDGNGAMAVCVVTFGNRNFDSSLTELVEETEWLGFRVFAAGAWVCRHVFSDKIAAGRPDAEDYKKIDDFADRAAEFAVSGYEENPWKEPIIRGGAPVGPYYVPKGEDGKPAQFLKAKPFTDAGKCTKCGICANVCPMGSISKEDFSSVPGICIKCQACVVKCPEGAKFFDDPAFLSHVRMLEQNYTERKEAEWYFK